MSQRDPGGRPHLLRLVKSAHQITLVSTLLCSVFISIGAHSIVDSTSATIQQNYEHRGKLEGNTEQSQLSRLLTPARLSDLQAGSGDGARADWLAGAKSKTAAQEQQDSKPINHQSATKSAVSEASTSSTERSWIETILINIESINFDQERQREELQRVAKDSTESGGQIETSEEGETPTTPLSVAEPTDSAEDPLESMTAATTASLNATRTQSASSSESPLGRQDALDHPSGSAESRTDNSEQMSRRRQSSREEADIRLVETNNISALLGDGQRSVNSEREGEGEETEDREPVTVLNCEQAYTQCALRRACAPALRAYNDHCEDLIENQTQTCSQRCAKSMIALRSSEVGDHLAKCDCEGNEFCLRAKQRSQICRPEVERAVDPKTIVSCSTATWICMADQSCSTALEYYYRNCQSLFSQRHCSMHCNNSLAILHRQPKASKLINCYCDGSEEFPCVKYKTYTERLCLNGPSASSTSPLDKATLKRAQIRSYMLALASSAASSGMQTNFVITFGWLCGTCALLVIRSFAMPMVHTKIRTPRC